MTSLLGNVPPRKLAALAAACTLALSVNAQTTFIKADNTTSLNLPGAYTANSGTPTSADTLQIDNTITASRTSALGASLSVLGINQTAAATQQFQISNTGGATLTVGSGGITKSGTGNLLFANALTLGANQTWSINSGSMQVNGAFSASDFNLAITGSGTLDLRGSNTFGSTVTIGTAVSVNSASAVVTFAGANTFDSFSIASGTVNVASMANFGQASAAGDGGTNTSINLASTNATATFNYTGNTGSSNRTFNIDRRSNGASINVTTAGQTLTLSGNISNSLGNALGEKAVTLTLGGEGNLAINGVISDHSSASFTTSVTKTGTGTLTLGGTNLYQGATTVSQGTIVFANTSARPSASTVTAAAGTTVGLGVGSTGFYSSSQVDSLFANTLSGFSLDATTRVGIDTTAGDFTYATSQNAARGFTKLGTNALILTGSNTYTGTTTISGGTLQLGNGGTTGALSASSPIVNNALLALNRTDTVTQGTDFASAISGSGGLTQAGSGNLILAAGNTYTGATTVSAGTLSLGATNSLADTSNVILSGGTLATNSFADTVGTLSLLGNATIDFTSGGSFAFANSAAATWTGGMTLSLTSGFVSGSSLRFGLDATGLTGTQLGQISAAGFDSFSLNSSGFLVGAAAIPEPSTYAALAGLGALGLAVLRRRRAAQNNLNR